MQGISIYKGEIGFARGDDNGWMEIGRDFKPRHLRGDQGSPLRGDAINEDHH